MRKGRDGESGGGGEKKKIKTFLVATNIVASRPPERRPTATPTARANWKIIPEEFDIVWIVSTKVFKEYKYLLFMWVKLIH